MIEPFAQILLPCGLTSLYYAVDIGKHFYTSSRRLPIGRHPISYRLIHVRRPYTID